jgi:uncharacterized repeat protein (TIGR01451 family)
MKSQNVIVANDDTVYVTNPDITPPGFSSVIMNDQINGAPINLFQVNITLLNSPTPLITLDMEGSVVVNSQTPNGVYVLQYQICIRTEPTNCATAFVTVTVDFCRTPMPLIDAVIQPTCEVQTGTVNLSGLPSIGTWTITLVHMNGPAIALTGIGETYSLQNLFPGSYTLSVYQEDILLGNCFGSINVTFNINNLFIVEAGSTMSYVDFNNDGYTNVGDVVNYAFTVYNNSCTDFTDISITSSSYSILGGPITLLTPQSIDNTTFTATYIITQDDINNGEVVTSYSLSGLQNGIPIGDNAALDTFDLDLSDGIKLIAFLDTNSNGVQDNSEQNFSYGEFHYELNNNGTVNNVTTNNGEHYIYESNPLNSYNVSYTINENFAAYYTVSPAFYSNITIANGSGITTYTFAITTIPYVDAVCHISNYSAPPRPGFVYQNYLSYTNQGNQTIDSGTVTFVNDPLLTIINASEPGIVANANGFTLDFVNLLPGQTRNIVVNMQVPTIPTIALGQQVTNSFSISTPINDVNTTNNNSYLTQIIVGSYDPNDKAEGHGNNIVISSFSADDYLTYTIRFENTGTANAVNVKVDDLLNTQLDENTVRTISTSHPYILKRVNNALTWRFDGIDLPPSIDGDEVTGHGYIVFQVKPKSGFALGDIIPNTADIYFDFNPAIVTNTWTTEFVPFLGVNVFENDTFDYYPNPTSDVVTFNLKNTSTTIEKIEVMDLLGKTLLTKTNHYSAASIDMSSLSKGMYLVKVTANGQEKTVKITKN